MPILNNPLSLKPAPKEKYIENLSTYKKGQLLEMKERQLKLISNK